MALQPHPRSTVQQSRVRGSPLAGHRASGSDDDPSIEEGRGTPHDTPEGLEPSSCRSDHSNPVHTTLVQSYRVSEPKGGIGVLDKPSSPGSVWEGATPAGMLSAELPASSPPTEALTDPKGSGLTVAAIRPAAVNSRRDASNTQQHQSTELGRTSDEALGLREPAQNLSVSPSPPPLLAAAGQPPAPVPQSGAPGTTHAFPSPGDGACRGGARRQVFRLSSRQLGRRPTLRSPLRLRIPPRPKPLPLPLLCQFQLSTSSTPVCRAPGPFWT